MEVRHQPVHGAEPEAGPDEQRRLAGKGLHAVLVRGALQQAQRRGADGDDAAAGADGGRGLRRDLTALRVHAVRAGVATHRQEGAGADMQGDGGAAHARGGQRASKAGVKCSPAVGAATAPSARANTVW